MQALYRPLLAVPLAGALLLSPAGGAPPESKPRAPASEPAVPRERVGTGSVADPGVAPVERIGVLPGKDNFSLPPKDPRRHFMHRLTTGLQAAEARVAGVPTRDSFAWRVIFKEFFRPIWERDLVDHEDSVVNPYVLDVNYRTRRIPRNIELNQGDRSNINIEVNKAAFNLLGFADNRGVIAGVGLAVENVFPFRTADRHFGTFNAMLRMTDQNRHAFDFVLSAAQSEAIDREYANHYGGTLAYTYYFRHLAAGARFFQKNDLVLPVKFYGYAITEFQKRESSNTAQEAALLGGLGQPFASFQWRDIDSSLEPRRRDAVAASIDPKLTFFPLGLEVQIYSFFQQEEHKETQDYAANKSTLQTFREDGIGYKTRFFRYGLLLSKTFSTTADTDLRLGASDLRVKQTFLIRYEVPLSPADLQPTAPVALGLRDIASDCGFRYEGLIQKYSCERTTRDRQLTAWTEFEIRRVFVDGSPPRPGQLNVAHDRMRFRLSAIRYYVGRDPQTNLFSDQDLNKVIFPNELTALPLGGGATLQRKDTAAPRTLIRRELRVDLIYELAGFDFAHHVP